MLYKISLIITFSFTFGSLGAQTYAHLNLGNLLSQLPEAEAAEQELQDFRDSVSTAYEQKLSQLEKEYASFQDQVAEGGIAPVQQQKKSEYFQQQQQKLVQMEQNLSVKLQQKRQEKLVPLLNKVEETIKAVATEQGYTMVFDISVGALLFADESKDIEAEVLSRLQ